MLKRDVLVMVVLCGLSGALSAGVALNQDFEGFTLGSLGTTGQGSTGDEGGKWFALNAATYPAIVQDPADPNNNQCVRMSGAEAWLAAYSLASPILEGTPFVISFSVFMQDLYNEAGEVASFNVYVDTVSKLGPGTQGIALGTYTVGYLMVYDGMNLLYRATGSVQPVDLLQNRDDWVDIKVAVKSWDDGTGYGYYDTWINQGSGWEMVDRNPFLSSALHDGVNAILIAPRLGIPGQLLNCFDNVYITSEPLECIDVKLLNGTITGDLNADCVVDILDCAQFVNGWLAGPPPWF